MAKKTFKDTLGPAFDKELNPAMNFISPKEEEADRPAQAPEGYKLNPLYVETKSRRLQLLLQPSLYARIKERADGQGLSVNEYIHSILEEATREEQEQ